MRANPRGCHLSVHHKPGSTPTRCTSQSERASLQVRYPSAASLALMAFACLTAACGDSQSRNGPTIDEPAAVTSLRDSLDAEAAERPYAPPGTPMPYDTIGSKVASAENITPEMIEQGRALFHASGGEGASSCSMCHGDAGEGSASGPELRSGNYRNVTGTYSSIIDVVTIGIAEPKQFTGIAMPAMGGADMSEEEIRAVAAYTYTLVPEERRRPD